MSGLFLGTNHWMNLLGLFFLKWPFTRGIVFVMLFNTFLAKQASSVGQYEAISLWSKKLTVAKIPDGFLISHGPTFPTN